MTSEFVQAHVLIIIRFAFLSSTSTLMEFSFWMIKEKLLFSVLFSIRFRSQSPLTAVSLFK